MGGGGAIKPMEGGDDLSTFEKAKKRALRGGLTGAAAQGVNVLALMWMRTTMNYQMANGGTMMHLGTWRRSRSLSKKEMRVLRPGGATARVL